MLLLNKHISFENKCREMFIGKKIYGVVYGEIKFESENIENDEPTYATKYSDIDSLDYSIYFKTDWNTIYVFWDSTFFSYGLSSEEINSDETVNSYEQKWDVSNTEKWINIIGKRINDFSIY